MLTAIATFVLALVTLYFVYATIKENQKYRRFKLSLKKLDEFYSPLIGHLLEAKYKLNYIKMIKEKDDFITLSLLYIKPIPIPNINVEESIKRNLLALLPVHTAISENKILNESTNFNKIKEIISIKRHLVETETKKEMINIDDNKNNLNFLLIKYFIIKFNELYNNGIDFEKESYQTLKVPYNLIDQAMWDNWENFYKILQNDYDKLNSSLY
jgi:hypothetical protein